MGFSFLHVLYDILYISLLCAVILVTFFVVFLPQQPAMVTIYSQTVPVLQHTAVATLPMELAMLFAVSSLLYLKCIWAFIRR